jgi:hypothetical protein
VELRHREWGVQTYNSIFVHEGFRVSLKISLGHPLSILLLLTFVCPLKLGLLEASLLSARVLNSLLPITLNYWGCQSSHHLFLFLCCLNWG